MTGEKFKGLEKMADVVKELKSNSIRGEKSLKLKDRICFYDIRTRQWSKIVVCFNERNHLVNYGGTAVYGGSRYHWNIDGYIFTSQILKLIKLG